MAKITIEFDESDQSEFSRIEMKANLDMGENIASFIACQLCVITGNELFYVVSSLIDDQMSDSDIKQMIELLVNPERLVAHLDLKKL